MSSPGLNQRDAHHAIHQAAFREAEQLTLLLRRLVRTGDQRQALQVAAVLIEHWQTRTLRHAEAEEAGWYREILATRPELQTAVIALTRDHELLRVLLAEVQGILAARGIAAGVVERFEAMLLLNGIHSREEERRLLGANPTVEESSDAAGDGDGAGTVIPPGEPLGPLSDAGVLADPQRDIRAAPVPLAVARPALHARLDEFLRQRGVSPVDLQADLRTDPVGRIVLHVAYGHAFARTMEWPLEAGEPTEATEAILRQIADACERAAREDYHVRMRMPT